MRIPLLAISHSQQKPFDAFELERKKKFIKRGLSERKRQRIPKVQLQMYLYNTYNGI